MRSCSSEYASLFDEYTDRTPTTVSPQISGVLRQLLGRGVRALADSPRSSTGSEFLIVIRFAATQPLSLWPRGTRSPLISETFSPDACDATSSSVSSSYR